MSKSQPRPVKFSLERLTPTLSPQTLLAEVQRVWSVAAGAFADRTEPIYERGGTVTVACGSAVWAQELDLLSEQVIARLNSELGRDAVRAIRAQAVPNNR